MTPEIKSKQDELEAIRQRLAEESHRIFGLFAESAKANAVYEEAKNQSLIFMFDEEKSKGFKRTEAQRQSIYREEHKEKRLMRDLAKNEVDATKSYISILGMMQSNLQTQLKLEIKEEQI